MKAVEKALQKGDIGEASKLINKASEEVNTARYFGQERKYWSAEQLSQLNFKEIRFIREMIYSNRNILT
nr:hypothetical protein [Photorhabdus australis]